MGFHFISYSHQDGSEYARQLSQALETGTPPLQTWGDWKLIAGERWMEGVERALLECDSLIYVMTQDSVRSGSQCVTEWANVAYIYRKPTILLKMDPEATLFQTIQIDHVEFSGDFEQLVQEVREAIANHFTPQGWLNIWRHQLREAERELGKFRDHPDALARKSKVIEDLRKRILEQETIVADPARADQRVVERIEKGMQHDRMALSRPAVPERQRQRMINQPPRLPPKHFKGRADEGSLLIEWIKDPACRVITVQGRAGCGKTTLVCRVLQQLLEEPPTPRFSCMGIVYLGRDTTQPISFTNFLSALCHLLPAETAARVEPGLRDPKLSAAAKTEALLAEFTSGTAVVMLDGFEDMLSRDTFEVVDPEVREAFFKLLSRSIHSVTVIATTRFVATDLRSRETGQQRDLALERGLPLEDAQELLRALDGDGHQGLRKCDPEKLAEAWRRTHGNPRALELLHGLLASNPDSSLDGLLDRLPESLSDVLVGEAFASLDARSQGVMQGLAACSTGIFAGVSPTAVDFVLRPFILGIDSKPVLGSLARSHLVRRDRTTDAGGGLYILDTVDRDYALARLPAGAPAATPPAGAAPEPGESAGEPLVMSRHALLCRASEYYDQLRTPSSEWTKKEDLNAHLASFELLVSAGEYDRASRVLWDVDLDYLMPWGHYRFVAECRRRLEGRLTRTGNDRYNTTILGICCTQLGDLDHAIKHHQRALKLARDGNRPDAEATELGCLGQCYRELGRIREALDLQLQTIAYFQSKPDRSEEGVQRSNLGCTYDDLGEYEKAIEQHNLAIEIAQELEQVPRQANRRANLAMALLDAGDPDRALAEAEYAVDIAPEQETFFRMETLRTLALVHLLGGNLTDAREKIDAARELDVNLISHSLSVLLGVVALRQGERPVALEAFNAGLRQADEMIKRTPRLIGALNAKALALCGLTLVEGRHHRDAARATFRGARAISSHAGVVLHVRQVFDALALADSDRLLEPLRTALGGTLSATSSGPRTPAG